MTELILIYNSSWRMAANKSDTDTDLTKNGESEHFYLWAVEGIWVMCRDEITSHKQRLCFRPFLRHVGGAQRVCLWNIAYVRRYGEWWFALEWRLLSDLPTKANGKERYSEYWTGGITTHGTKSKEIFFFFWFKAEVCHLCASSAC